MLDTRYQPALESLLIDLCDETSASAALLLHQSGQLLHSHGALSTKEYPHIAALVSAIIAAGNSVREVGASTRFSFDSEEWGLYASAVNEEIWLAALYDYPINPGLLRRKVKQCAELCEQIGSEVVEPEAPLVNSFGANLSPPATPAHSAPAKITGNHPSLFTNITDDEIDRLFENSSS